MKITVEQLARMVNGTVEGDGSRAIDHFAPIEEAGDGAVTFISNPKYASYLYTTQATAVLVSQELKAEQAFHPALIRVADVYSTLSALLEQFGGQQQKKTGIEQPAYISGTAKVGEDAYIGAFAYLGENAVVGKGSQVYPQAYIGDGVTIGENTIIYPGVKIYAGCQVGSNCILHAGCVVGSDGFGFAPQPDGSFKKIPQNGIVIIQDNVEIGANTTIDRATMKATVIEKGAKLDNLIQVAHNVEIGANTAIASQTGISGSTKVGRNCMIGGQVGIVGHITIAEGTMIGAQSGIAKTIEEKNQKWFGSPAIDYKEALRAQVLFKKLPELYRRIQALEESQAKSK